MAILLRLIINIMSSCDYEYGVFSSVRQIIRIAVRFRWFRDESIS